MLASRDQAAALSTRALVAGYERDLPIVRGVDFAVRAGELVVVLGPNGAGKSTFVKAIAGLVPVHSGTASLGENDITSVPAHQKIRHGLAFVPQTENIFATLSINDNLLLAANILPKDKRSRRVADLYAMFPDLAARPSLRAGQLSGGQRQMLAVARALIVEPSVLILTSRRPACRRRSWQKFCKLKINEGPVIPGRAERKARSPSPTAVILVEGLVRHEAPCRTASAYLTPVVAEFPSRRAPRPAA